MKFAHVFEEALLKGEYPQEWLESAISYRQLKKCIRRVKEELRGLGLDQETVKHLWQQVGTNKGSRRPSLAENNMTLKNLLGFKPTLMIVIDSRSGLPLDAWLSPKTRHYLQGLARVQHVDREWPSLPLTKATEGSEEILSSSSGIPDTSVSDVSEVADHGAGEEIETIEIPLTPDSGFFQVLGRELVSLEQLQEKEHRGLTLQIARLGHRLNELANSSSKKAKMGVNLWREVFRLYIESQVFFSSTEQDAGARDSEHASTHLEKFVKEVAIGPRAQRGFGREEIQALDEFVQVNLDLLRLLRYQEINRTAISKIMKKFDKKTALNIQDTLPPALVKSPFMVQDLAKATCFTISEELLDIIPQLEDYLCPVCFSISYKPIRLRCNHVFCIRCLILIQRANQNHCPLCRDEVVLEASSFNVDRKLMAFLKAKFPAEVKAKQRENEIAAGVDIFGEGYEPIKCYVM